MELTDEQEETKFKNDIRKVLSTLDKCVTEKELRKRYREQIGCNVNIVVDKVKAGNFIHFLRFKCRDFCDLDKLEGVHRVHRLFDDPVQSDTSKVHKKKNKTNAAPKLNFPRVGLINSSTFPRLNPQGFNKGKANREEKPLISLAYYQPKYSLAYRSAAELSKFDKSYEAYDQELESLPVEDYNYVYDRTYAEAIAAKAVVDAAAAAAAQVSNAPLPSVKSSFDFPSLPTAEEPDEESSSDHGSEDHEDCSSDEAEKTDDEQEQTPMATAEKVLEGMKKLTVHETCSSSKIFYAQVDLDDSIFRFEFPPVVTDQQFSIPSPKMTLLGDKVLFEVNLTVIHSPAQFWFQYGDASLYILMNRLKAFYSSLSDGDLFMSGRSMQPGLVVAAKVLSSWHRAQVVSGPDGAGNVCLFFLDFGTSDTVHMSNIRYMLQTFTDTPVKALRGSMVGVCPAGGNDEWSYSARKAFFELVADKRVYASIRYVSDDFNVHQLELTDQANSDMRIAQVLSRLKLADPDHLYESLVYAIPVAVAAKKFF